MFNAANTLKVVEIPVSDAIALSTVIRGSLMDNRAEKLTKQYQTAH